METHREALRGPVLCLAVALAIACAGGGCSQKDTGGAPTPVNQEANKKSMESSGDFYKQKYQSKK